MGFQRPTSTGDRRISEPSTVAVWQEAGPPPQNETHLATRVFQMGTVSFREDHGNLRGPPQMPPPLETMA